MSRTALFSRILARCHRIIARPFHPQRTPNTADASREDHHEFPTRELAEFLLACITVITTAGPDD